MMYGFGDDENPLPETAACMQQVDTDHGADFRCGR
ncbi:unnamed protein product [Laminaria digitata]